MIAIFKSLPVKEGAADRIIERFAASRGHVQNLAGELSAWFRGRFNGVVPGIGYDHRATSYGSAGPSLPEWDPLTPANPTRPSSS